MKLSTLFKAYQRVTTRREMVLSDCYRWSIPLNAHPACRRIRQADKLEKAIARRIATMEQTAGEREPYAPIPQEFYKRLQP